MTRPRTLFLAHYRRLDGVVGAWVAPALNNPLISSIWSIIKITKNFWGLMVGFVNLDPVLYPSSIKDQSTKWGEQLRISRADLLSYQQQQRTISEQAMSELIEQAQDLKMGYE